MEHCDILERSAPIDMTKTSNRRQLETDLHNVRAELAAAHTRVRELLANSESLAARVQELETELAERPGDDEEWISLPGDGDGDADEGTRESQLARRVAELEAARAGGEGAGRDADAAAAQARELAERIQSLELQLEAARIREDELTTRTVHTDGLLADLGLRLADLGAQAELAERLGLDVERLREESAFALSAARDDAMAARSELEEVRVDLGAALEAAEGTLAELGEAHRAAVERMESAEVRADEAETRAAAFEEELLDATRILRSLEQVYTAIRDRVDGSAEISATDSQASGQSAGVTPIQAELQGQLEGAILRVQGLELELQEGVEVLQEQARDLTSRLSDAEAAGHRESDPGLGVDAPAVRYLTVTDLLAIGARELGLGTAVDVEALEAIASLPFELEDGHERFPGIHLKAAAQLAETLHRQPFSHGNDHVALMTVVAFLGLNGYEIDAEQEDLAELTRIVAEADPPLLHIAAALEAASTPVPAATKEPQMDGKGEDEAADGHGSEPGERPGPERTGDG